LIRTSNKKSRSKNTNNSPKTALKSIENKNSMSATATIQGVPEASSSRKRPYRLISNDTGEDAKEQFQLIEKFEEISNYNLIVE
jgi:hypothetical protein